MTVRPWSHARLTLACYDGSAGSRQALGAAGELLSERRVVVLTVWVPTLQQLNQAFVGGLPATGDLSAADFDNEADALLVAEEGAQRARERGFAAKSRVEGRHETTWRTIVDVANELDVELILIGRRGRNILRRTLLGDTCSAVLHHARRPVLVTPITDAGH